MNGRERFLQIAHFKSGNEVMMPSRWQKYWPETLERWKGEGMPQDVHAEEFFGLDRVEGLLDTNVCEPVVPLFDQEVLEEEERTKVIIDIDGVKKRVLKNNRESSMDQWLEYPVKDRTTWQEYKRRLDPHSPARYPKWWQQEKERLRNREYPLGIYIGSFFGWMRHWIGIENLSYLLVDDQALIEEIMEYTEYFIIETIKPAIEDLTFDFAYFWEDMAWKNGSLISLEFVNEHMVPRYEKVTDLLHTRGIDVIALDSDGNINGLIPLWLEAGINCVFPNEVAAGMDIVAMRKKYGRDLIIIGGIDKRALAGTVKDIEEEVMKKVPCLLSTGGYFPLVDHDVPPDVPLKNYQYFLDLIRKL
ncbi:MAG: uroporphyrinogen decarboxylase family protein [bacterium]